MIEVIRPVRHGMLIGLLGLIFGIGWAFYLVLGHEGIHQGMEKRAAAAYGAIERDPQGDIKAQGHEDARSHEEKDRGTEKANAHVHKDGAHHQHDAGKNDMDKAMSSTAMRHKEAKISLHGSPLMEIAHTRLARGHLHAMGLGLATILISLLLAFTTASERIKTAASVLTGLGGLIYPLAWIVMGYMTPTLGPEGAESSVIFIAGPGVGLMLSGVFTAAIFLVKDILSKRYHH
ncbi:MAG: hypothetical protein HZB83_08500 [Deltaproteobacteria bacterium]|nr:hypothetical protein [Deltaproteobacteria bacterium]